MGRMTGLEPAACSTTSCRSTIELHPPYEVDPYNNGNFPKFNYYFLVSAVGSPLVKFG